MKNKISKRLIAFLLCMVLVIGNSVSILADTPAPEKATVENQTKDASTTKKEDASKKTKAGDGTENVSAQSEDSADTEKPSDEDPAPEVKTTEEKKETTEASTEKKEDSAAADEDKDDPAEVTTKAKVDTDKTDETTTETTTGENNQETEPASETTTKAKEETTGATTGATTETNAENGETAAASVRKYEYKSDDVNVTVTLSDPADLPDEAELTVKPVELSKEVKEKIIKDAVGEENEELVNDINAYDITFMLDGEEVQPKAEVKVSISKLDIEEDQEAFVYHVDDNDKIEDMGGKVNKEGDVVFDTTHFSEYAVLAASYVRGLGSMEWYGIDEYNTMLQKMKDEVETPTESNIPITSWERTADDDSVQVKKVNQGDSNDWTWTDVLKMSLSVKEENRVWDGSRLNDFGNVKHYYSDENYLGENVITATNDTLYDSATWTFKDNKQKNDDASLHRFRGEFSIGNINPSEYAFTVKQVTGGDRIYVNDDIYIFIYPKTVTLTKDNYVDYLAFWTGTIVNDTNGENGEGKNNVKFQGIEPAGVGQTQDSVSGLNRLTNGWYLTAEIDNVGGLIEKGYRENGATEFYIDVVADDYSAGGGMYRLLLEKEAIKKYPVQFQKIDSKNSSGIPGAEFSFSSSTGKAPYTAKSDENGNVNIELPAGTYTMRETSVPDGYEAPNGYWRVVVQSNGTYTITWHSNNQNYPGGNSENNVSGNQNSGYKITNTPAKRTTADFEFVKVKSDGNPLAGAEFKLVNDEDQSKTYTVISSSEEQTKGIVSFKNLPKGTYTLSETEAPEGYVESDYEWKVIVKEDDSGDLTATLYQADGETEVQKINGQYQICNQTGPEWLESNLDSDKTVKVKDWDERTYDITITASSKATSTTAGSAAAADVVLVLDKSGSMDYTSEDDSSSHYEPIGSFSQIQESLISGKVYYKKVSGWGGSSYYPMIYVDNKWQYYNNSWKNIENNATICTSTSRMTGLKEAAIAFVSSMSVSSPNSKLAVTTYDTSNQALINLGAVGTNKTAIIKAIAKVDANGGTSPGEGLEWAYGQLQNEKIENRNVILFTDGEPTADTNVWESWWKGQADADEWATTIKNAGITLYTVGLELSGRAEAWLAGKKYNNYYDYTGYGIASPDCALNADNAEELQEIFQKIQQSITESVAIGNATVTDVIDPRFDLVDALGNPIEIPPEGEDFVTINKGEKYEAKVYKDNKGQYTIVWSGQTIEASKKNQDGTESPGWSQTITVKAKENYIGGNDVPTNVAPDSSISATGYGEIPLPQPTVNVKADFIVNNNEVTIFKGETVPTGEELTKLFDETKVQRVVEKTVGDETTYELVNCTMGNTYDEQNHTYIFGENDFNLTWYGPATNTDNVNIGNYLQYFTEEHKTTPDDMEEYVPGVDPTYYYLQVTFNPGKPTDDSNDHTTQNGAVHYAGEKVGEGESASYIVTATNVEDKAKQDNQKRPYGVYTIHLQTGTINIIKKSGSVDGDGLANAVFKIEKWIPSSDSQDEGSWETVTESGANGQITTGKDGTASFTNLGKGKYRITEIQAPEGHSLLANPIIVEEFPYPSTPSTIEAGGVSVSEDNIYKTETINDVEVNYYHTITYTIVNNKLFEMPEAGGRNIFLLTLAGTAMIALAGGSTIYYRRRRGVHNRRGR